MSRPLIALGGYKRRHGRAYVKLIELRKRGMERLCPRIRGAHIHDPDRRGFGGSTPKPALNRDSAFVQIKKAHHWP